MQGRAPSGTLVRTWIPERSFLSDLGLVLAFSLFNALLAQISIPLPFTPVPITGQTFAVLLTGALLGSRLGVAAILAYLAEGSAGLPFFAGGAHGFAQVTGPTGGYLVGFLAAAFVVGWLAERGWVRDVPHAVAAMLAGEVAIYVFGLAWLSRYVPASQLLALGLTPFIPGDAIKLAAAAIVLPTGWRLRRTH